VASAATARPETVVRAVDDVITDERDTDRAPDVLLASITTVPWLTPDVTTEATSSRSVCVSLRRVTSSLYAPGPHLLPL